MDILEYHILNGIEMYNPCKIVLISFIFLLTLSPIINAETNVYNDTIYGEEIWDISGSPYYTDGKILIEESGSLFIDSGVIVYCTTNYFISNKGEFTAVDASFMGEHSQFLFEKGSKGLIDNCEFFYTHFTCWGICSLSVINSNFVSNTDIFWLLEGATPIINNNLYAIPPHCGIRLSGLSAGIDWHLPNYEIPYHMVQITLSPDSSNVLSFAPGATINFADWSEISVSIDDSLILNQVNLNRTGNYYSYNIWFEHGSLGNVNNCIIDGINLVCRGSSKPLISNNIISNTLYAIYISDVAEPIITGNTFIDNNTAIMLHNSYNSSIPAPVISNNFFESNGAAIFNKLIDPINAENNWWGSASGPQHIDNPGGTGDPIIGFVDYFPWLVTTDLVEIDDLILPSEFELFQNYPNPFNNETKIEFVIPKKSQVTLEIFNILGQTIRTLVNDELSGGRKYVVWDGKDRYGESISTGTYFYRLRSGSFDVTKKMILLK